MTHDPMTAAWPAFLLSVAKDEKKEVNNNESFTSARKRQNSRER